MSKNDLKTLPKEEINVRTVSLVEIKDYEFVTDKYNAKSVIGNQNDLVPQIFEYLERVVRLCLVLRSQNALMKLSTLKRSNTVH